MPAVFPVGFPAIAHVRQLAASGDHLASVIMALMNNTYYVAMTAGAEASNVIRVSGQITDQDGQKVAGVKNVLLTSVPISGAGTMAIGTVGTAKAGAASKALWLQTDATGAFNVDVTNIVAEDNLIMAQLDNGTCEQIVLTYA